MKIYFIYKGRNNPNLRDNYKKLEKVFGKGYLFCREYPRVKEMDREEIREKFTKDIKKGNFDFVIVDITYGKGRLMKEEIALAKKLKIPIIEVNFLK